MIVCHCLVVNSGTITACVRSGSHTPKLVARETAAGTVCGRCVATIRTIIDANWQST